MINFIKSIFGGSSTETPAPAVTATASGDCFIAHATAVENPDELEKFVEFIVRGLVDKPEEVSVQAEPSESDSKMLRIHCAKEDIGKVVGKKGKTIIALRSLINGAAGRIQRRVLLEVAD